MNSQIVQCQAIIGTIGLIQIKDCCRYKNTGHRTFKIGLQNTKSKRIDIIHNFLECSKITYTRFVHCNYHYFDYFDWNIP